MLVWQAEPDDLAQREVSEITASFIHHQRQYRAYGPFRSHTNPRTDASRLSVVVVLAVAAAGWVQIDQFDIIWTVRRDKFA